MLTHWGWDKMAAISQTTLSNVFSWMKILEFWLKFHWSLLTKVQLTIFQHWFRYWLGADQATSHYLNQWWLDYQCIYASFSLNELTHWQLETQVHTQYCNYWCRGAFSTRPSVSTVLMKFSLYWTRCTQEYHIYRECHLKLIKKIMDWFKFKILVAVIMLKTF